MPSKLGPHFIGTPGLPRWIDAGARVFKFDPTSLGASGQIPPAHWSSASSTSAKTILT